MDKMSISTLLYLALYLQFAYEIRQVKAGLNANWLTSLEDENLPDFLREKEQQDHALDVPTEQKRIVPEEMAMDIIARVNEGSVESLVDVDIRVKQDTTADGPHQLGAVHDRSRLWTTKTIPYLIDESVGGPGVTRVMEAIKEITDNTCITFIARTTQSDYLHFKRGSSCSTEVGKSSGEQLVSLRPECFLKGVVLHLIKHSLGFYHEHSRADRNDYIKINWENINEGNSKDFARHEQRKIDYLQETYDYGSIMHFGKFFGAKDRNVPSIEAINSPGVQLGRRDSLSATDINRIKELYNCGGEVGQYSSWSAWSICRTNILDSTKCFQSRQRFCYNSATLNCSQEEMFMTRNIQCTDPSCSVNGHWGRWGPVTGCDGTCDLGKGQRKRSCDDPKPRHGGVNCVGASTMGVICRLRRCDRGPEDTDFEDGFGNWENMGFTRWNSHTPTIGTGPSGDHTLGNGYYIFYEATGKPTGDKATLTYKEPFNGVQSVNIQFYYHMYGNNVGTLRLVTIINGQREVQWEKSGNQGEAWKLQTINLKKESFRLAFEVERSNSFSSDIALDDIFLDIKANQLPAVPDVFSTSFDFGICPWVHADDEHQDWYTANEVLISNQWHEEGRGNVLIDTTTGRGQFGTATVVGRNEPARMFSQWVVGDQRDYCLSFVYYVGMLKTRRKRRDVKDSAQFIISVEAMVGASPTETGVLFLKETDEEEEGWKEASVDINFKTGSTRLVVKLQKKEDEEVNEGSQEKRWRGYRRRFKSQAVAAIDNLIFSSGRCLRKPRHAPDVLSCAFNEDLCSWKDSSQSNMWEITRGGFAVLRPSKEQSTSILQSPASISTLNNDYCVTILAQIKPKSDGTLILKVSTGDSTKDYPVNQGSRDTLGWSTSQIDLPRNKEYQLKIEGKTPTKRRQAIKLDEISVRKGKCNAPKVIYSCDFGVNTCCLDLGKCPWNRKQVDKDYALHLDSGTCSRRRPNRFKGLKKSCPRTTVKLRLDISMLGACVQFRYKVKGGSNCGIHVYRTVRKRRRKWNFKKSCEDVYSDVNIKSEEWKTQKITLKGSTGRPQRTTLQIGGDIFTGCHYYIDDIKIEDGMCK